MKKQLFLAILVLGIISGSSINSAGFAPGPDLRELLKEGGEKLQAFASLLAFLAQEAQITQEAATSAFAQSLDKPVIPVIKSAFAKIHKSTFGRDLYNLAVAELDSAQKTLNYDKTKPDYFDFLNKRYQAALAALKPNLKTFWGTNITLPAALE